MGNVRPAITRNVASIMCDTQPSDMEKSDATTIELRRVLARCPICSDAFADHHYALFAITIISEDDKERLTEFFSALKEHRWQDALRFQEFDSLRDAAEAFAVRCSNDQIACVVLRSPAELYDSGRVVYCELLNDGDTRDLEVLIKQSKWKSL